jgi:hypothetical protein
MKQMTYQQKDNMPKLKHPTQINVTTFNTASEIDYKLYKKYCKDQNIEPVDYRMYKKVLTTSNQILSEKVLDGKRIKLPFGLSDVFINKYKQEVKNQDGKVNLPIDWKRTKEFGKKIYHLNKHTDGFIFKWFWAKGDAKFKFKDLWSFKAVRKNTRAINNKIKQGEELNYKEYQNPKLHTINKRKYNATAQVEEYDARTKKLVKVWENRNDLINHYEITINYFNKLIALPGKRWLKGKTYIVYKHDTN